VWIELNDHQRERLEARARILEYEAGLPRRVDEVWCSGMLPAEHAGLRVQMTEFDPKRPFPRLAARVPNRLIPDSGATGSNQLVADVSVRRERQALLGNCRPTDVAAQPFELLALIRPRRDAGLQ
jgi:hypothetical protein